MQCVLCGKEEIYNKKRQLCKSCYSRLYNKGELKDVRRKNKVFLQLYGDDSLSSQKKFEFIKNFFDHDKWYFKSVSFQLLNGKLLVPDFYDIERDVFIKVILSRQAYSLDKEKYREFKKLFYNLELELRTPDGNQLNIRKPNWFNTGACSRKTKIEE